jgi:DNA-binding response OmpR family regulator
MSLCQRSVKNFEPLTQIGDRSACSPAGRAAPCPIPLAEAKAAVAARRFDVVILDMTLPDGTGTELLSLLKTEAGDPLPVIVFSARSTDPDTARQVQVTLTKSQNSLEHLVRIVSRLCRSARSYQNQPAGSSP